MTAQKPASWAYAEEFVTENDVTERARRRGEELGAAPVGTGAGAVLRLLAAASKAKSVIEIGTGAGTSGLWLLQGMPADGILTTIDVEPEHQAAARRRPSRVRRRPPAHPRHQRPGPRRAAADDRRRLRHGRRRRREDGVPRRTSSTPSGCCARAASLVLDNMLWHDRVADPAARDEQTTVLRDLGKTLRDDERLLPALLPVGDGVLAAVKR